MPLVPRDLDAGVDAVHSMPQLLVFNDLVRVCMVQSSIAIVQSGAYSR